MKTLIFSQSWIPCRIPELVWPWSFGKSVSRFLPSFSMAGSVPYGTVIALQYCQNGPVFQGTSSALTWTRSARISRKFSSCFQFKIPGRGGKEAVTRNVFIMPVFKVTGITLLLSFNQVFVSLESCQKSKSESKVRPDAMFFSACLTCPLWMYLIGGCPGGCALISAMLLVFWGCAQLLQTALMQSGDLWLNSSTHL